MKLRPANYLIAVAAIALHDALEFLRIMFEQVQIFICQVDPARIRNGL